METTSTPQQREITSQINTPNSEGSTSMSISTTNSSNNNGGGDVLVLHHTQTPPSTPKPISTSHQQTNPYPTTFVQANTSTFKQVVQMLTGSSPKPNPDFISNKNSIPPIKTSQKKHQQHRFKLYERRNQQRNKLIINPLINHGGFINSTGSFSPRNHEIFSPSFLDFPNKLVLSPVTPLTEDPFNNNNNNNNNSSSNKSSSSPLMVSSSEEDKVIAERGFYLHPSPVSTPRECELQLLPLFPVTSPRVSGSCS